MTSESRDFLTVKVHFSEEIHRFRLRAGFAFEELTAPVTAKLTDSDMALSALTYVDPEGDPCSLTAATLTDALDLASRVSPPILRLSATARPSISPAPPSSTTAVTSSPLQGDALLSPPSDPAGRVVREAPECL
jgi:hypothetical protein